MTLKPWQCFALMALSGYLSSEIASYRAEHEIEAKEAEAHFKGVWLCNYVASLSAKSSADWKLMCLGNQFQEHFKKDQP